MKQALKFSDNLRGSSGVFAVCMGKQRESVFRHCDLGRAKSLSTRGSGHNLIVFRGRYAPELFRRFAAEYEASFGDFRRFCAILGDFSVGTPSKHTQLPGS